MDAQLSPLLPCPFCGSQASDAGTVRYSERHAKNEGWDQVEFYFCNCPSCGVSNVGVVGHQTRERAVAAWNRRALADPTVLGEGTP